jgi:hypothetical protein
MEIWTIKSFSRFSLGIVLACLLANSAQAATERAFIGTFTSDPTQKQARNHGEGIYLVDVAPRDDYRLLALRTGRSGKQFFDPVLSQAGSRW